MAEVDQPAATPAGPDEAGLAGGEPAGAAAPAEQDTSAERVAGGRGRGVVAVLLPAVVYVALGMLRIGPAWRAPTRLAQCGCGDGAFVMWFLGWTPFSLAHGTDMFFTDWMLYPRGLNTLWNVSLPLPALLLGPATTTWNVVLGYNLLVVIAFAGSALSAYLVLRRFAPWPPAAFAGGLLFGFSPYMISQGLGHLHLVLLPLVPLVLLLLHEILVRQRWRPWITGPLLGGVAVAQLLTAEEVLASLVLVSAVGVVVLLALFPRGIPAHWRHAVLGLGLAAVTAGVLAARPLQVQLSGPQRLTGTVSSPDRYRADLLSWIMPTRLVHFAPDWAVRISAGFGGNLAENGSYLGIPLLLVAVATPVVLWRRRPVARWAGITLLIVMGLAAGPSLRIRGVDTGIWMPLALVRHLWLLQSVVSVRLAAYAVLLSALLLAVAMDAVRGAARAAVRTRRPAPRLPHRAVAPLLAAALAVVALLPLLPWLYHYGIVDTNVPQWYRSASVQRVPADSVLVTVPGASPVNSSPMLWQAIARYRFKVPFGYALNPRPSDGRGTFNPPQSSFLGIMNRIKRGPPPRINRGHIRAMRVELARWNARTVVVVNETNDHVAEQVDLLTRVLGRPPVHDAGAWVWYDLDPAALAGLPVATPPWPPQPVSLPSG